MNDEELEMLESDIAYHEWLDRLAAERAADQDAFVYGEGF
jgi:ribosome assembly protein YihI (activator of Der GTPase)